MNKLTIREVARIADVSVSTVSRVINNNYPTSCEVKEKVSKVIKELNFHPNAVARSLKSEKTKIIGIIVANISNHAFMQMAKGIETVVEKENYNLIICSNDNNLDKEKILLQTFKDRMVDAVIDATCSTDGNIFEDFIRKKVPVVLLDRRISGFEIDSIADDNFNASYKIVEHLIHKGHRRIGIINGIKKMSVCNDRLKGYLKAHKDNEIEIDPNIQLDGCFDELKTHEEVLRLFNNRKGFELPSAIFATSNLMAEVCMKTLIDMGLSIPNDISLVSFGEPGNAELIRPKVTAVKQQTFLIGKTAGELVLSRIRELKENGMIKCYRSIAIESPVVIGESVKEI